MSLVIRLLGKSLGGLLSSLDIGTHNKHVIHAVQHWDPSLGYHISLPTWEVFFLLESLVGANSPCRVYEMLGA